MSRRNHRKFTVSPSYVFKIVKADSTTANQKFLNRLAAHKSEIRGFVSIEAVQSLLAREAQK